MSKEGSILARKEEGFALVGQECDPGQPSYWKPSLLVYLENH